MTEVSTFDELLNQYIIEKPLSSATIVTYKGVVNRFTKDTGIESIDNIPYVSLLEWRLAVTERSSDITWNNYLRHMRALWKFAIHKKFVPDADHFKELNWGRYKTSKTKTISSAQLDSIMSFLADPECSLEPSWFWRMVVRLLFLTGIRRKQLINLKWGDVDLETRLLYLSAQGEKTRIERHIPLPENLIVALTEYKKLYLLNYPRAYNPEAQLFNITLFNPRYSGKEMTVDQLSRFFRRLSSKLDFKISPHMLRHTMATEIARTGQIKPLQQILGHTDIRTTLDFYVHPDMDQLRGLLNGLHKI
ncbi:MAG: site-specific integrase [Gammaproteobacteria bacterium]|nr:site-specific integrase [Gammaproteobacteria bacterium]MBL7000383.1 site-specific integrase [Gammaproteobacteria bacterium]